MPATNILDLLAPSGAAQAGGGGGGGGGGAWDTTFSAPTQASGSGLPPTTKVYVPQPLAPVSTSTGNTLGASTSAPVDPYAKYGGKEAYDRLVSGFGTQKSNIYGTATEAAQNAGIGIGSSILDFIDSLKSGQQNIDNRAINAEMALRSGKEGVLGMVNRGIKSGGVTLAGRNATDSSAAGQIARAYGDIGRREMSGVGNQYEMENRDIGLAQADLETQRAAGVRKIGESKNQVVNNIVLDARSKLAALDAAMVDADVPDRINIEQEKEAIRQQALQALAQYDAQLSSGVAGVNPTSIDQRRSEAVRLSQAGQAPSTVFDFTTQVPLQMQNTGPVASNLPLFTFPYRRQEA